MSATKAKGVPILISLDAQSTTDGQPEDVMRMITTGELLERPDETIIRYEESLDESEPPQQMELSVRGGVITMHRQGSYDANMVFQKGQRYEGQYTTPHGQLDMAIYCTRATFTMEEESGELSLQYQLDLGGQFATMHELRLHFVRKKDA